MWINCLIGILVLCAAEGTPTPGGSLTISAGTNSYGNDVKLRDGYLTTNAKQSWFDFETRLPAGMLQRYYFYVHPTKGLSATTTVIRLQIWRPIVPALYQNMLVWEKQVNVDLTSDQGLFYQIELTEAEKIPVETGDHLGFSNTADFGVISFQYVEMQKSYFRNIDNNQFPKVSQTYTFDNIFLPAIFSIAAGIDTWCNLTTSAGTNYGNNVTLRDNFLPTGAEKSWFDFETWLPAGMLQRYSFYVHPTQTLPASSTVIRLQIWRPINIAEYQYMLVWEKRVNVDLTSVVGLFYQIELTEAEKIRVEAGDHLGFSNTAAFGVISFQYGEMQKSYFRKIDNNQFPKVSQTYTFDNIFLPAIFSIAAGIDTLIPRGDCQGFEVKVTPSSPTALTGTNQTIVCSYNNIADTTRSVRVNWYNYTSSISKETMWYAYYEPTSISYSNPRSGYEQKVTGTAAGPAMFTSHNITLLNIQQEYAGRYHCLVEYRNEGTLYTREASPDITLTVQRASTSSTITTALTTMGPEVVPTTEATMGPEVVPTTEATMGPEVVPTTKATMGPEVVPTTKATMGPEVVPTTNAGVNTPALIGGAVAASVVVVIIFLVLVLALVRERRKIQAATSAPEVQRQETSTATPGSPPVASIDLGTYLHTGAEQTEVVYETIKDDDHPYHTIDDDHPYPTIDDNNTPYLVILEDTPYDNAKATGGHYEKVEDTYLQPVSPYTGLTVVPSVLVTKM